MGEYFIDTSRGEKKERYLFLNTTLPATQLSPPPAEGHDDKPLPSLFIGTHYKPHREFIFGQKVIKVLTGWRPRLSIVGIFKVIKRIFLVVKFFLYKTLVVKCGKNSGTVWCILYVHIFSFISYLLSAYTCVHNKSLDLKKEKRKEKNVRLHMVTPILMHYIIPHAKEVVQTHANTHTHTSK